MLEVQLLKLGGMLKMDLLNKVVLVTGASRGLGREIALAFGREGSQVVVNHRDSHRAAASLVEELPKGSMVGEGDVSSYDAVEAMMEGIRSVYGRIDVLVNNAGWTKAIPHDDLDALTPEIVERVMRTNFNGTYNCVREAIRSGLLTEGVIVNVSSLAAQTVNGSNVAYCASKAAVDSMTLAWARALGPKNIRVNAVAPGLMKTDLTASWIEYHTQAAETNPLRREPTLKDVADTVVYLAKNESLTGVIVNTDAGQALV
jgi:NAD(P)-dependent dehydrogenase (short-subunit alcohol dehydrogenase family)